MNKTLKIISVLTIVSLLSGGILAWVYSLTLPSIQKNQAEALRASVFKVLPEAKKHQEKQEQDITYYECLDKNNDLIGYALPAKGTGYQGEIKLMLGIDKRAEKLTGLVVLEQVETPGLGARIAEEKFQNQFKNIAIIPKLGKVDTITGATVSSRSVINIISRAIEKWLKIK